MDQLMVGGALGVFQASRDTLGAGQKKALSAATKGGLPLPGGELKGAGQCSTIMTRWEGIMGDRD